MGIKFEGLEEKEMEELRAHSMGELAVKLLASMNEKNMLVIKSYGGYNFYSYPDLKDLGSPFTDLETSKMDSAISALMRRGYVNAPIGHDYALLNQHNQAFLERLNGLGGKQWERKHQGWTKPSRERANLPQLPWSEQDYLFEISNEGRIAAIALQARLQKIQAREKTRKEDIRFLALKVLNRDGDILPGLGAVYRIADETREKFRVERVQHTDGAPPEALNNIAVERMEKGYKVIALFVRKEHVLAHNITMEQYLDMYRAWNVYRENEQAAKDEYQAAMEPIKNRLVGKVEDAQQTMQNCFEEVLKRAEEQKIRPLIEIDRDETVLDETALDF